MKLLLAFISAAALCISSAAQSLQERISMLASDPAMNEAYIGICVRTPDGQTIVDINSEKMLIPASNMKLISTGAALYTLGTDHRYETRIGYSGEINDGILHGDLYIIGGGDPTLGSKDSISTAIEKVFSQWESMVRKAGIKKIEGAVVGDGSWLDGMMEEPTWLWNDLGTYYGTGVTGLMFYENMQSFNVSAGEKTGDEVKIEPSYPYTPWMEFRYECSTGEMGTGDMLYMYTSEFAPVAAIRGTFGVDRAPKRVDCANKFPEYTCAALFVSWLDKKGIRCTEGPADYRLSNINNPSRHTRVPLPESEITLIGSTFSPTLDRIAFETNHVSNNLFAETILRTLGKNHTGNSCYDSSYVAIDASLKKLKINTSKGLHLQDGSGLSRQNLVSPDFFCRFLTAMLKSACHEEFLESLPYPGGNGSLQYNMKGQPAALRERVRVKSGSMNGVRCYSGYILPEEGSQNELLVISIMTNNCTAPNWKVRPLLDKMMIEIASWKQL